MRQQIEYPKYRISRLETIGRESAAGTSLSYLKDRYPSKIASMFGAIDANYASQGAYLARGGTTTDVPYQTRQMISRLRATAPFVTDSDTVIIDAGLKDLETYGTACFNAVRHALRSAICWPRASGVFQIGGSENHSSTVLTGTWIPVVSTTSSNSGSGVVLSAVQGDYATITVPSTFPGGEIGIGSVIAAPGNGVIYSIAVTGATTKNLSFDFLTDNATNCYSNANSNASVMRILDLNPGAHTIVVTSSTLQSFGAILDHWYVAADPVKPMVVVMKQPKLGNSIGNTSDDNIGALNSVLKSVCDEFTDGNVLFCSEPIEAIENNSSYIISGATNWNEVGAARIAEDTAKQLLNYERDTFTTSFRSLGAVGRTTFNESGFLLAVASIYNNGWTDATAALYWPLGGYETRNDGSVKLSGRIKKNVGSPSYGENIITLPGGARPSRRHTFLCSATPGRSATLDVLSDGKVNYVDGSVTNGGTIDLDGIEFTP